MSDVAYQSAKRHAGQIRHRKIGCLKPLDHYRARVEPFNPALNAIIETCIPAARERARAVAQNYPRANFDLCRSIL